MPPEPPGGPCGFDQWWSCRWWCASVTPVLQVVRRVITRHLLGQAGLRADEADSGAVTLIQRFGSAANLNIHLHWLVLDGCTGAAPPVCRNSSSYLR